MNKVKETQNAASYAEYIAYERRLTVIGCLMALAAAGVILWLRMVAGG